MTPNRLLAVLSALLLCGFGPVDDPRALLAGNWGFVGKDGSVTCGFPAARGNQLAFDFTHTDGRLLLYEAADLIQALGGVQLSRTGDRIAISAQPRLGGPRKTVWTVRVKSPDELESLDGEGVNSVLRRCPTAAFADAGVSNTLRLALTPPLSGAGGFPEIRAGDTLDAVCEGQVHDEADHRAWAQFELIGPTHQFVMITGLYDSPWFGLSKVDAVRQTGPDTLVLSLTGLDKEGTRNLTVKVLPDRLLLAELNIALARCRPEQAASGGMAGW